MAGRGCFTQAQSAKRVELFKSLTDLGLEKDDQEDHEYLPQNLEDPRGQEKAPGLRNGKDDTKCKQSDKGLERLGAPEPQIKVVGHHGQEKDVEDVLDSKICYESNGIHERCLRGCVILSFGHRSPSLQEALLPVEL